MTEAQGDVVAATPSEAPVTAALRSKRRVWRMVGIVLINTILVVIIAGLLVATWLPAYVYHNPDIKIGESQAK